MPLGDFILKIINMFQFEKKKKKKHTLLYYI